ncbi:MAG: hypothetical protein U5K76_06880 [Woeseiaceae bacterium]|nr:hypothetical protein [Woeseiaceae bacterium]
MAASRELGANSILVGRLQPGVVQGNRWSYYFGTQRRSWNGDAEDAIHLLADTLAGEFAFAGNTPMESHRPDGWQCALGSRLR